MLLNSRLAEASFRLKFATIATYYRQSAEGGGDRRQGARCRVSMRAGRSPHGVFWRCRDTGVPISYEGTRRRCASCLTSFGYNVIEAVDAGTRSTSSAAAPDAFIDDEIDGVAVSHQPIKLTELSSRLRAALGGAPAERTILDKRRALRPALTHTTRLDAGLFPRRRMVRGGAGRTAAVAPFARRLKDDVEHRDQEDADAAGDEHTGEDRGADVAATNLRRAMREDQRHEAEHEGYRGHHDGAEAHARAENRRIGDRHALLALLLGEFDDKDAVLGRERDEHDKADLGVEVERQPGDENAGIAAEHADDDREQDRNRDHPALIEADQEQEGEHHRGGEDRSGLPGRLVLLIGGAGPFVAVAGRQRLGRDLLHRRQCGARGGARRRAAIDGDRAVVVVARDHLRADDDALARDRAQRHHPTLLVAHMDLPDIG